MIIIRGARCSIPIPFFVLERPSCIVWRDDLGNAMRTCASLFSRCADGARAVEDALRDGSGGSGLERALVGSVYAAFNASRAESRTRNGSCSLETGCGWQSLITASRLKPCSMFHSMEASAPSAQSGGTTDASRQLGAPPSVPSEASAAPSGAERSSAAAARNSASIFGWCSRTARALALPTASSSSIRRDA
eukprot:scaffold273524_cov31-Tisochrysis_lutea.AAC.6